MTETASLIIKVDSSGAAKATDNLNKLDKAAGNTERAASKLGKAWGVALGLISSAAIVGATRAYIQQADAFANMSAKLKLVTGSTEAATKAQRDLYQLAQSTSSELGAVTDLYVKLGQSSKELAGNHELLLGITEKVSKALVISGADAASSAAVIRQFSQAMAAGALRGDEFISVMEGAPRLARAIADGMGVAVGSLRKLAAEGKLTSDEIIRALENQGEVLDREFGEMPLTVSRATQQVRNALQQLIGDTDQATGASADLAKSIESLARTLESEETKAAFASIVQGITSITSAIASAIPHIIEFNNKLSEGLGLQANANGNRQATAVDAIAGNINGWKALASGDWDGMRGAIRRQNAGMFGGELPFFGNVEGKVSETVGANAHLNIPNVLGLPDFTAAPGQWNATQGSFRAVPNWRPPSKPTATGGGSGGVGSRALPNFADDDLAALQRVVEATARANEEFDRLAATLAGPLAEAQFQHKQSLEEIDSLAKEAGKSDAERVALREAEIARYEEETEAIEAQLNPVRDLIAEKEFELSLMGMSEAERRTAIDLRNAEGKATDEQAAAIRSLNQAMEDEAEKIGALDDHRALFEDFLVDLPKRGKDAWKDFLDDWGQMMTRMAARKLVEQVFGGYGTSGGGSSGGDLLGGLIGAFLGGGTTSTGPFAGESAGSSVVDLFSGSGFGFATGGYTGVGGRNQVAGVAHKGEVVWSQDDVARAGGVGAVERMRRGGGRGGSLTQNFIVNGTPDRRTREQMARDSGREARRGMARTGG